MKLENNQWFIEDGNNITPVDQALDSYLKSDEGKHFIPAAKINGSGTSDDPGATGMRVPRVPNKPNPSLNEAVSNIQF
jgi:hypothetical protein